MQLKWETTEGERDFFSAHCEFGSYNVYLWREQWVAEQSNEGVIKELDCLPSDFEKAKDWCQLDYDCRVREIATANGYQKINKENSNG